MKNKVLKVAIVGGGPAYHKMIRSMGHMAIPINNMNAVLSTDWGDIDVALYTGGADVNPKMYGHTKHPSTYYCDADDLLYDAVFSRAYRAKQVGICRGSQYLCVKAGGTLIQDLDGHAIYGTHKVMTNDGEIYEVTSTHHQMQYPINVNHELLAFEGGIAKNAVQHIDGEEVPVELEVGYEAVWYPDINALAFQPHPEFPNADSTKELFVKLFNEKVLN